MDFNTEKAISMLLYFKENKLYNIGHSLGIKYIEIFPFDFMIGLLTGELLFLDKKYKDSYKVLCRLKNVATEEGMSILYNFINTVYPYVKDEFIKPNTDIIQRNPLNLITFVTTTCKRPNLFINTMNSFLNKCTDKHLISDWICIDDNSSKEDIENIKRLFPFLHIISKDIEDKGHPRSLNIMKHIIQTPYVFLLEDDWTIIDDISIVDMIEILNQNDNIGQCLLNQYYTETLDDWKVDGGDFLNTRTGKPYIQHLFIKTDENAHKYVGHKNSIYWPHFSLRPGITKTSVLNHIGKFNENVNHFEMEYAYRYINQKYKTCFLRGINSIHTGRLTSEMNDETKLNAYKLNNEGQFNKNIKQDFIDISISKLNYYKNMIYPSNKSNKDYSGNDSKLYFDKPNIKYEPRFKNIIVNMKNRVDRKEHMKKQIERHPFEYTFFNAIDGNKVNKTQQLYQLFEDNDYNYRCGMIGCALSHIFLWYKLLADKDNDMYVVLEDDIEFNIDYPRKLSYIVNNTKDLFDIMFIGHFLRNPEKEVKEKLPTWVKWSATQSLSMSLGGTIGYIITKAGAMKMIEYIEKIGMTNCIDTMMQKAADVLNVYYTQSHLIKSECFRGDNRQVDTDIQFNFNTLYKSLEERLYEDIELFIKHNIDYKVIQSELDTYSDEMVYITPRNFKLPFEFNYTLDKFKVYIPPKLVTPDIKTARPIHKLKIFDKEKNKYVYSLDMIYNLI